LRDVTPPLPLPPPRPPQALLASTLVIKGKERNKTKNEFY
jgi:hypothetical protein